MLCQLRWMKDLEELLKTVEVYFSINLFLDINIISDKYLTKNFFFFFKKVPYTPQYFVQ